jgi:hypothetical protein
MKNNRPSFKRNKYLIMKKLLLVYLLALMLSPIVARNSDSLSDDKKHPRTGAEGIYALWYKSQKDPDLFLRQPYITGGQMVFQWKELAPEKGKFDFSKIAGELDKYGRMGIYTTIQINGNLKPDWLYEEVPYHPEKFSEQIRDKKGSLMYWHPTHKEAYLDLLKAFAEFMRNNGNRKYLLGIRQNFNGFGTEHLHVPTQNADLNQWIVPEKIDKSIDIKPWSKEVKEDYEAFVLDNYIKLFSGVMKVFVRNTINENLEARYKNDFRSGKLCWFHTSSEAEPRSSEVERQYRIFYDDCRSGKTLAYAEPWASAWGHHGIKDDRWCSPPQWFYWTHLFNLHCGVTYIGIYSSDMQVAIDGTYNSSGVHYQDGDNRNYQKEFTDTLLFAKKYAGFHDTPDQSPGAWVAFRENDMILAANKMTEEKRKLAFFTGDYNFLMERLPDKSYGHKVINIGPDEQRFGAWARVLPAGEHMKLRLNPVFLESCKDSRILVRMTYYDGKGKDFNVLINGIPHPVKCEGLNQWNTKVIEIKDGILKPDDKLAHITIQNNSENIYLHMVEVTRS